MDGACRRDAYDMARVTRAVWAGSQLSGEGVDRFIASLLEQDRSLPPEQAVFALQASTTGLPKVNRAVTRGAA